ncbi:MAG: VCBS repeat-containing protein [Acidobacteria bacterium]|nr:VCBS repeat-containing protein [Acidobacteriota bacterium]
MADSSKPNLLRSWKDISAHLGCDVRTCHRWEANLGMPVHRAEGGGGKSPVFAYRDELDAWFRETFKSSRPNGNGAREGMPAKPRLAWVLGIGAVAVLAGGFVLYREIGVRRQPAGFEIDGPVLIVKDKHGRELWRFDTKVDNLEIDAYYRANFQVINKDEGNLLPIIGMWDIDADGDREVLFALRRQSDQTGEGRLYCFDRKGVKRWEFLAGGPLVCGGRVFSPDYRLAGFVVRDHDGDGRLEIVTEAFHAPDWPCQLAVLDCEGRKIGDYRHAGYLREIVYHDIDGDGREELIVVGVNNEYRGGAVAVFDPRDVRGGSPQTGEFACAGIGPGSELYYVTTPYTDVSAANAHYVCGFNNVDITESKWIRATTAEGLIMDFGFDLECLQVGFGHGYRVLHDEGVREGRIASVLDDAYKQMVMAGVRYWNGSAFVAEPTPVKRPTS